MVFSATNAAAELDGSTWMTANPWASWLLGIVVALAVHALKSATRPVINAGTAGVGAPVASTAEDAGALGMSLIAVFMPRWSSWCWRCSRWRPGGRSGEYAASGRETESPGGLTRIRLQGDSPAPLTSVP